MSNYESLICDLEEVQYQMEDLQQQIDNFDKEEHYSEEDFKEILNDSEPSVEICGISFYAGDVLAQMDPIAFSCAYSDYVDSMENDEFEEYRDLLAEMDELQGQIDDLQEMIDELEEVETEDF